jgi:hypothetical protein
LKGEKMSLYERKLETTKGSPSKKFMVIMIGIGLFLSACSSRNYTSFLLDEPVNKNASLKEQGPPIKADSVAGNSVMKVRWNDGRVFTEVDVPLLNSGQRIVIEHSTKSGSIADPKNPQTPRGVVVPPPTKTDDSLAEAYKDRGLKENTQAPEVSITRTRSLMQEATKSGNYSLALEYCEAVLTRFPSHPEFLRAKGSLLLLVGEREKAIETYEKAEEIESTPQVKKKLEELQKN